jgi:hypothetical protein
MGSVSRARGIETESKNNNTARQSYHDDGFVLNRHMALLNVCVMKIQRWLVVPDARTRLSAIARSQDLVSIALVSNVLSIYR